jgi:hypothetical protein
MVIAVSLRAARHLNRAGRAPTKSGPGSEAFMVAEKVRRWLSAVSEARLVDAVAVETDEELAQRNSRRLEQAKQALGRRYLLHPSNRVHRPSWVLLH